MKIFKVIIMVALLFAGLYGISFAETIGLDEGSLTVIEAVAPLGSALSYVSGGDGLIGQANVWPTMADTPANRSFAASNIDHTWMQYDPAIIWSSSSALSQVFAIPGVDHGPVPQENLEFIIWGSNDSLTWEEGAIQAIYRDGFDTTDTTLGHSDDYTSLWGFSTSYSFFRATSGDHLAAYAGGCFSCGEGEIDGLAAASSVPEPSTLLLLGSGLLGLGLLGRKKFRGNRGYMLVLLTLVLTIGSWVPMAWAVPINLITNGDFENPSIGAASFVTFSTTGPPGWTLVSGTVDLVSPGFSPPFEGNQVLDLDGVSAGLIQQSFATVPGQEYMLEFHYADNPLGGTEPALAGVSVSGFSGIVLNQNITHAGSTLANMNFTLFSQSFIASDATSTLAFSSQDPSFSNGGIFLDAVSVSQVSPVPEPSTLLLLASGLAGLGFWRRMRKDRV